MNRPDQQKGKTMNKPIQTLRDGLLTATIWRNQSQDGNAFYNVRIVRSYLKEDTWREASSFSGSELLRLSRLSQAAYDAIARHRKAERQAQKEAA